MSDCLVKSLICRKQVRLLTVRNTNLVRDICDRPAIRSKLLRQALGETVTAASLLAGTLKDRQRLSLKIKVGNPAGTLFADVDADGNVRGYPSDDLIRADPERLDAQSVERWIGDRGCIQVVKDIGMYRSQVGMTDMPHRHIADDLSHYFRQSEQTRTAFFFHLQGRESGRPCVGLMAQALPGADDGVMARVRGRMARLADVAQDVMREAFERLPSLLFEDAEILDVVPVRAFCGCSQEAMLPLLYALGADELAEAVRKNEAVRLVCNACGKNYTFGPDDLRKLTGG